MDVLHLIGLFLGFILFLLETSSPKICRFDGFVAC